MLRSHTVEVEGLTIHHLEAGAAAGEAPTVMLLHGWPTSSFLWRNVMPVMAEGARLHVVAPDLVGFGKSDKPLDASYSYRFRRRMLDGFLAEAFGIGPDGNVSLAVHDLGGPVGLYWACQRFDTLDRLALLNTLCYPQLS